jgi:hypothetical protein
MGFRRTALVPLPLLVLLAVPATAAETSVPAGASPEITVYPGDLALVRDRRTFRLQTPEARLAFEGVSGRLQPETVAIDVVPPPPPAKGKQPAGVKPSEVKLLDQTFAFNLMTPHTLLEQSIGKDVTVVTTNPATGRDNTERAKVVSVQDGVVLDIGGKLYTGLDGRFIFDAPPGNLRPKPALLVTAAGPTGKDIAADISYLTGGLGWHADYVARYDSEGGRLDLSAWATVSNTTGTDFTNAKLKLAAGDVNRVTPPPRPVMAMRAAKYAEAADVAAPMAGGVSAQALDNLQLYTIARPTTLANGETKQLMLLQVNNLPVKRDLVVRGQQWFYTSPMPGQTQKGAAEIEVSVKNEPAGKADAKGRVRPAPGGLGLSLPPGVVRAYGEDDDGALQFLGEDRTDAVIPGGEMQLHLGKDTDLAVTRDQVSFAKATDTISISGWRIAIRNNKARSSVVRVTEPVPGAWEIVRETVPHKKNAAGLPEWTLTIPAKGETVLEYNVKTQL